METRSQNLCVKLHLSIYTLDLDITAWQLCVIQEIRFILVLYTKCDHHAYNKEEIV